MLGAWDAETYARQFRFVPEYGRDLIGILAPQEGEKILDLGCGPGALTAELASKGAIVTGVDADAGMIAVAQKAYPHITFLHRSADHLNLTVAFDAVFSNAALHWMKLDRVFPQVAKILRLGGRFAAEMGGRHNIAAIERAIDKALKTMKLPAENFPKPWYFPTVSEAAALLEQAGLEVHYTHLYDRPTILASDSGGLAGWVKMFGRSYVEKIPAERQDEFLRCVEDAARPELFKDGTWMADYRRFHFVAVKK